jgi:hypothetical protein
VIISLKAHSGLPAHYVRINTTRGGLMHIGEVGPANNPQEIVDRIRLLMAQKFAVPVNPSPEEESTIVSSGIAASGRLIVKTMESAGQTQSEKKPDSGSSGQQRPRE